MVRRSALLIAAVVACAGGASAGPPPDERSVALALGFWQEAEPLSFPTRTQAAVCADLDGDGFPELVRLGIELGDPYGGTLEILQGGEYGPQLPLVFSDALPSPRSIRAADVNGDGRIDLIAVHLRPAGAPNAFVRTARLYIQTGASAGGLAFLDSAPTVDLAPGGELVLLADVDQDQVPDLVSAGMGHELFFQRGLGLSGGTPAVPSFAAQAVSISQLAAQAAGLPPGSTFNFGFANDLACGDFDGDGSTDVAVAVSGMGGGLHLFHHRQSGWARDVFSGSGGGGPGASFTSLACGDFDGDGRDDLVATSPARDLTTLLNRGPASDRERPPSMQEVVSPGIGGHASRVASADFDGDGWTDVAWFDEAGQRMLVALNPAAAAPPGVFSTAPALLGSYASAGSMMRSLEALDVDGDGDIDLVGSALATQTTAVICNERMANARKPRAVLHLRGTPRAGELADTFVPDRTAFEQGSDTGPGLAVDCFAFHARAGQSSRLRLRVHARALEPGVAVRLGLMDVQAGCVRWSAVQPVSTGLQEIVFVAQDAAPFVAASGRLQTFVMSSAAGSPFRLAIDQISAEVIP